MKVWNFGIIGPGKIAHRFAEAFREVPGTNVYGVASRDNQKAKAFATRHGAERIYSSYNELIKDPAIDIVYIATPHSFHCEQTLLCLQGGKAVLCEKPLAINARQVTGMIEAAQRSRVFLLEGMWSRFFPAMEEVLHLLRQGTIGDVKTVKADFGFTAPRDFSSRIYDIRLGGGAQLDVGVYPLFLALLVLGKPLEIRSSSQLAATGADTSTDSTLIYEHGATAHIQSSIIDNSPLVATIEGTKGTITIESPWYKSQQISYQLTNGKKVTLPFRRSGNGFEYQLHEVVKCLSEGKIESERMPHAFSLMMAEVSDEIRRQGKIRYPEDV